MSDLELLQQAVRPILGWFRENKRDLPWRHGRTFYTCLVAELMLQQTRVEAVKEKYVAFLKRFPTEKELALASEDEVMKAWEGLGYYSRARNLKKAAETLFREGTPRTWVGVKSLAGVGNYTAGALSSIALGLKEPAVDGNVVRILTRLLADKSEESDGLKKKFSDLLRAVYPEEAGEFCEALMELGALVCVPNGAPLCGGCPWKTLCRAHATGEEEKFPVRAEKKERRVESLDVYVLKYGDRYALRKREKGLLKGLWEFPNADSVPRGPSAAPRDDAGGGGMKEAPLGGGIMALPLGGGMNEDPLGGGEKAYPLGVIQRERKRPKNPEDKGTVLAQKTARHVFTHVEWRMTGYLIEAETPDPALLWATAEEIETSYAIPSAFKAFKVWIK